MSAGIPTLPAFLRERKTRGNTQSVPSALAREKRRTPETKRAADGRRRGGERKRDSLVDVGGVPVSDLSTVRFPRREGEGDVKDESGKERI